MTDTTAPATDEAVEEAPADEHHDEHVDHPSEWEYVKIALVLGVITALEVFTYFESVLDWGDWLIPALLFMMVIKFWLVAMWFMHLKFDNKLFSWLFAGGLALAVAVYVVALTVTEFFS